MLNLRARAIALKAAFIIVLQVPDTTGQALGGWEKGKGSKGFSDGTAMDVCFRIAGCSERGYESPPREDTTDLVKSRGVPVKRK